MSKVVIEIAGAELDIAEGIGFGLNYQVDDVKNPTKRNGSYSKTITLAGTKNNNKVLGGLFDVNADFTFFNPNIKTNAKIIIDSSTVLDGYMQLRNIKKDSKNYIDGNNVQYEAVIFSASTNFFSDIEGKNLSDVDFSRFNHLYTKANIEASWTNTPADVYTYPLLYKNSNSYNTKDFKPAMYHKAYLKRIAQEAGYTLSGTILDNATDEGLDYSKEIIPFNGDIPLISDAEYERRLFQAGMSASTDNLDSQTILGGIENGNFAGLDFGITAFTSFDDDTTPPFNDVNGHWNTTTNEYTIDADGSYQMNYFFNLRTTVTNKKTIATITNNGGTKIFLNFTANHNIPTGVSTNVTVSGTVNYDGTYTATYVDADTLTVTVGYVADEAVGTVGVDAYQYTYNEDFWGNVSNEVSEGIYDFRVYFHLKKNGSIISSKSRTVTINDNLLSGNDWTEEFNVPVEFNFPAYSFLDTDVVTIEYYLIDNNTTKKIVYANTSSGLPSAKGVGVDFTLDSVKNYASAEAGVFNGVNPSDITDGDSINLNEYIPQNIKQSDIITDLIKRYNAYISVDEDNDRNIIIDTRDSYYAKGGTLDWTDKKDFDYQDKIELLSDLQNKELILSYKSDKDDFNENYSKSVDGDIYGQKTIEFTNEFVKGENKIETPFSPTPLIYNSTNPVAIVPAIDTVEPKTNMRVLYFDGVINCINDGEWGLTWTSGGSSNYTTYSTYPYAGHYDNPLTPSKDLNFGYIPYAWYSEAVNSTNGDLYNRYWSNYVNQIDEGKLVTMRMNLTSVDIAYIKNHLNDKIWVKDSYYYINKIKDYNPIIKGLTVVEFLKIPVGVSYVSEQDDTGVTPSPNEVLRKSQESTRTNDTNISQSEESLLKGLNNSLGVDSDNALIVGDNNLVSDNSPNSVVLGNNNMIENGVEGGFIIGTDDKTVSESGEGWIGETHFLNGLIVADDATLLLADLLTKRDNAELTPNSWYYAYDEGFYFLAVQDDILSFSGKRVQSIIKNSYYGTLGIFVQATSYVLNDKIIWGGRVWNCILAGVSASTDARNLNSTNWEMELDSVYYEDKVFDILYSEDYSSVLEQRDERGNIVTVGKSAGNPVAFLNYTNGEGFLISDWGDIRVFGNTCAVFVNNDTNSMTGNECGGLINNTADIQYNRIHGDITYNQVGVIDNHNNGSIYSNDTTNLIRFNSNTGDIFDNTNDGFIGSNSNNGNIEGNSNNGNIIDNNNNGDITDNTSNALTTFTINNNINNGYIKFNNSTANITINNNINNGFIGAGVLINRAVSIFDTAINK